jgi:hypothetical protein
VRTATPSPSASPQATRKAPPGAAATDQSPGRPRWMRHGRPNRPFARPVLTTSARSRVAHATALVPSAAMPARGVSSLSVPPKPWGVVHPVAAPAGVATASSAAVAAMAVLEIGRDMAHLRRDATGETVSSSAGPPGAAAEVTCGRAARPSPRDQVVELANVHGWCRCAVPITRVIAGARRSAAKVSNASLDSQTSTTRRSPSPIGPPVWTISPAGGLAPAGRPEHRYELERL